MSFDVYLLIHRKSLSKRKRDNSLRRNLLGFHLTNVLFGMRVSCYLLGICRWVGSFYEQKSETSSGNNKTV